jgi:CRISPR-associated endonuclease Cas1
METTQTGHTDGVLVVQGAGIALRVRNSMLEVADGVCNNRRTGSFPKAGGLRRIVVASCDGYLTLEALQWLHDAGVELVITGRRHAMLAISTPPHARYPALVRGQALAAWHPEGGRFMKELLAEKLDGQAGVCHRFNQEAANTIRLLAGQMRKASDNDLASFRTLEARAAIQYWNVLAALPVSFARRQTVPPAWRRIGDRISPLTRRPQRAVTPAQALFNYAYTILTGEQAHACMAHGLCPGIGILHTDAVEGDNLAYDLLEPLRPVVDRLVLDIIAGQTFVKRDFGELPDGCVVLDYPIRRRLTEIIAPAIRPLCDRTAVQAASVFGRIAQEAGTPAGFLPPFARGALRRRSGRRTAQLPTCPALERRCVECGRPLATAGGADLCDTCRQKDRDTRQKRRNEWVLRRREWERQNSPQAAGELKRLWTVRVLPRLQNMPVAQIAAIAQVSERAARKYRAGTMQPHPSVISDIVQWLDGVEQVPVAEKTSS